MPPFLLKLAIAVAGAVLLGSCPATADAQAGEISLGWSYAGPMSVERYGTTATTLDDGRVLVLGGHAYGRGQWGFVEAELFDPDTGAFTKAAPTLTGRYSHTASLLNDGRVLVAGGQGGPGYDTAGLPTAEIYDPQTDTWSATGEMVNVRLRHSASVLPDGRVLVAGGYQPYEGMDPTAEIYDPATDKWTATGLLAEGRSDHSSTVLSTGKVLVVGGCCYLASAELFDPLTGSWSSAGTPGEPLNSHAATTLPDGRVLVTGGHGYPNGYAVSSHSAAHIYDPASKAWSPTTPMRVPRRAHSATLLSTGKVLVAGGCCFSTDSSVLWFRASSELYDPLAKTWTPVGSMAAPRSSHAAVALSRGRALVVGGLSTDKHGKTIGGVATTEMFGIPETLIDSGPSGAIKQLTANFTFSATTAGATFECRLDQGEWEACTSPKALAGLPDGEHAFRVRATDASGNTDPSPATRTWTVDTAAPETSLDLGPAGLGNLASPVFGFSSSEAGATFECRLDDGQWAPCTSPRSLESLLDGEHTFSVRATDAAGNTDETPATRTWTRDTLAPETSIDLGPVGVDSLASPVFGFSSEPGATFECRLDQGAWAACLSPHALGHLVVGEHTFSVRATDAVGNTDASPATRTWTLKTSAPIIPGTPEPAAPVVSAPWPVGESMPETTGGAPGLFITQATGRKPRISLTSGKMTLGYLTAVADLHVTAFVTARLPGGSASRAAGARTVRIGKLAGIMRPGETRPLQMRLSKTTRKRLRGVKQLRVTLKVVTRTVPSWNPEVIRRRLTVLVR